MMTMTTATATVVVATRPLCTENRVTEDIKFIRICELERRTATATGDGREHPRNENRLQTYVQKFNLYNKNVEWNEIILVTSLL